MMKPGAIFINASRGTVVDIDALADVIKSGHLSAPPSTSSRWSPSPTTRSSSPAARPGQRDPDPHRRLHPGSPGEHRSGSGQQAGQILRQRLHPLRGQLPGSLLPGHKGSSRLLHIHRNQPGVMNQINQIFADEGINIAGQYLQTSSGSVTWSSTSKPSTARRPIRPVSKRSPAPSVPGSCTDKTLICAAKARRDDGLFYVRRKLALATYHQPSRLRPTRAPTPGH